MELSRMSNQERLRLCRRYFYIGFLALPFLWIVNTVWFGLFLINYDSYRKRQQEQQGLRNNRRTSRQRPYDQRQQDSPSSSGRQSNMDEDQSDRMIDEETKKHLREIRSLIIYSFIGSLIWIVVLTTWVITYQLKRAEWGEFGDQISFNIPRGIP